MGSVSAKVPESQSPVPVITVAVSVVVVTAGQVGLPRSAAAGFFARRPPTATVGSVGPSVPTGQVVLNEAPAPQYDLMTDLIHVDMFTVLSDMLWIETD
jgi:hypothetical protein